MLNLPDHAVLDKIALIGGCAKLPITFDVARAVTEISALPQSFWGSRGGRVGVHNPAQAVFLRGYAPAEGNLPVEDREALSHLPYLRELIEQVIPAQPLRCLLALLPGGSVIAPHIDKADYFAKTLRIHFPITSHEQVWMYCEGLNYQLRPGEIWALNNSAGHGVLNADAERSRLHMICDFLPSPELIALLARSDKGLAQRNAEVESRLFGGKTQLAYP